MKHKVTCIGENRLKEATMAHVELPQNVVTPRNVTAFSAGAFEVFRRHVVKSIDIQHLPHRVFVSLAG